MDYPNEGFDKEAAREKDAAAQTAAEQNYDEDEPQKRAADVSQCRDVSGIRLSLISLPPPSESSATPTQEVGEDLNFFDFQFWAGRKCLRSTEALVN